MSNEIVPQVFDNPEFGQIRAMRGEDGEPWFVASDIAKALGYRDAERMTRRLDNDEKGTRSVGTPGGNSRPQPQPGAADWLGLLLVLALLIASGFVDASLSALVR